MMKTAETRNEVTDQPKKKFWEGKVGVTLIDLLVIFVAGMVVATAYYFFQNSNNFAPAAWAVLRPLPIICSFSASAGRF